ncbi:MAG: DUF427 domain-containing protein [Pseudomonadota bacterium]
MSSPIRDRHITVRPRGGLVTVRVGNTVVSRSERALDLLEGAYKTVIYIPREDVDETVLERTDHTTYCPCKGEANYFSIVHEAGTIENAAWTYEAPLPDVSQIKNALAFYPSKVKLETE